MILVTVGTQFFDELIDVVDDLAGRGVLPQPVFAQIGLSKRIPRHARYVAFERDLLTKAAKADLIITHAGTGSLLEFIRLGRPMIAVVNPTKLDNHQLEFLQAMEAVCDFCWVETPAKLEAALPHARIPQMRGPDLCEALTSDLSRLLRTPRAECVC